MPGGSSTCWSAGSGARRLPGRGGHQPRAPTSNRPSTAAIHRCDVALVIIGDGLGDTLRPHRSTPRCARRLRPAEVAAALASGVPVVPVLVDGAPCPSTEQLPEDLAPLARRQAVIVRDDTWHQDIDALVRRLQHEEVIAPRRRRSQADRRRGAGGARGPRLRSPSGWLAATAAMSAATRPRGRRDHGLPGAELARGSRSPSPRRPRPRPSGRCASLLFTVRSARTRPRGVAALPSTSRSATRASRRADRPFNEALFRTVLVDGPRAGRRAGA